MENKVLELIKLHTNNLQKKAQTELSLENEQLKLAQEIIKLFAIPVVKNCCLDPKNKKFKNSENGIEFYCSKCNSAIVL